MIKMKISKSNRNVLPMLVILIFLTFVVCLIKNNHLELIILTISLGCIFKLAKFSYFTIFSFILWFSFLQEYFASINRALSSGRLAWNTTIPIYHTELFICTVFLFLAEIFIFITTKVLENEKSLYKENITMRKSVAILYVMLAFLLVLLAYPSLPGFGATLARDEGIISSSFVVPIAILIFAITYDHMKKSIVLKIVTIISLIWIVFHGDRVIVLGYLIYILLKYMNDGKNNFQSLKSIIFNKKTVVIGVATIGVLVLFIKVQITRVGGSFNLSVRDIFQNIIKQGTAGDVVYAFNCAVDMWKNGDGMYGYTYLYYLSNLLPSANQELYPAVILIKNYETLGGGLYFVEPMMNGGIILTCLQTLVFLYLLVWVCGRKNRYGIFLIIPFIILIFRFTWYASFAGLVKMLLYYVPVFYWGARRIKVG